MKDGGRLNFFIKLAVAVMICFCAVSIITLRSQLDEVREKEEQLLKEKEEYEEAIDKLKSDLEHEMDYDYIMRIAREKLSYYLPDEIIFYNDR